MAATGFDETPEITSKLLTEFAQEGWVNIVGGCCGTTPNHIKAISDSTVKLPPRKIEKKDAHLKLSGLEAFNISESSLFVNVGERTNVTGSKKFADLILNGKFEEAVEVARQQVENGAQIIDVNMDEAMLDSEKAMIKFLNLVASEPDISRVPIMIDSSKWSVIESGLKCVQGKALPCTHLRPDSITDHFEESIIMGTRDMSGSEATKFKNLIMAFSESSIASSMLTSMICAPFSTCCLATSTASSNLPFKMRSANFFDPVTLVLSPTLTKRDDSLMLKASRPDNFKWASFFSIFLGGSFTVESEIALI